MRYLIASLLTPPSDQALRHYYFDTYSINCPVKTLHLTFIPPFTLNHPQSLQSALTSTALEQTQYSLGTPGIFSHSRHILYLPLAPTPTLDLYYHTLLPQISPQVTFAATDFAPNHIPDFLPHITLDYNFRHQLHLNPPNFSITLNSPSLLTETQPGIWQPYAF